MCVYIARASNIVCCIYTTKNGYDTNVFNFNKYFEKSFSDPFQEIAVVYNVRRTTFAHTHSKCNFRSRLYEPSVCNPMGCPPGTAFDCSDQQLAGAFRCFLLKWRIGPGPLSALCNILMMFIHVDDEFVVENLALSPRCSCHRRAAPGPSQRHWSRRNRVMFLKIKRYSRTFRASARRAGSNTNQTKPNKKKEKRIISNCTPAHSRIIFAYHNNVWVALYGRIKWISVYLRSALS